MKKISILFIVALLLGCAKELDIEPTTSVDSNQAKESLDLLVTGAYSLIGSGPGSGGQEGALYSTDLLLNADLLAAEDYMTWRGTFNQYNEVSNKSMSTTNTSVTRIWRKAYAAINLANVILANINNASVSDRDIFKGHALFIRGAMNFELLRFWMEPSTNLGIPLLTEPTEDFSQIQLPARSTIAESYTAILDDLTEAQTLLPANDGVYANQYVVTAFLARVYLHQGDYVNALANADLVISSNVYSLPTSVEEAFNTNASSERIFEIQQTVQNNAGTNNDGLTTFYACDPNTPGSSSRGDVQIDSAFINLFEAGDKRLTLLIYAGTCNKASTTSAKWKDPYANIPVVRLSEMYLIRAECNDRLASAVGDTPLNDVNAIRSKAGATPYGVVGLPEILLERDLELAFEGQRIHDYKRTGKILNTVDNQGNPVSFDYTEPQFILPIPQTEINTNSNLVQNSFYQ